MPHSEIPVKVNAWVDQGIAPLVEALSTWDNVVTLDSCEAGPSALAYVQFTAEPTTALVAVATSFADSLSKMETCPAVLTVEWAYGGDVPLGKLTCPADHVHRLSAHLVSCARKSASSGDTARTDTRNSRVRLTHQPALT
jgi:hypothetical protein